MKFLIIILLLLVTTSSFAKKIVPPKTTVAKSTWLKAREQRITYQRKIKKSESRINALSDGYSYVKNNEDVLKKEKKNLKNLKKKLSNSQKKERKTLTKYKKLKYPNNTNNRDFTSGRKKPRYSSKKEAAKRNKISKKKRHTQKTIAKMKKADLALEDKSGNLSTNGLRKRVELRKQIKIGEKKLKKLKADEKKAIAAYKRARKEEKIVATTMAGNKIPRKQREKVLRQNISLLERKQMDAASKKGDKKKLAALKLIMGRPTKNIANDLQLKTNDPYRDIWLKKIKATKAKIKKLSKHKGLKSATTIKKLKKQLKKEQRNLKTVENKSGYTKANYNLRMKTYNKMRVNGHLESAYRQEQNEIDERRIQPLDSVQASSSVSNIAVRSSISSVAVRSSISSVAISIATSSTASSSVSSSASQRALWSTRFNPSTSLQALIQRVDKRPAMLTPDKAGGFRINGNMKGNKPLFVYFPNATLIRDIPPKSIRKKKPFTKKLKSSIKRMIKLF